MTLELKHDDRDRLLRLLIDLPAMQSERSRRALLRDAGLAKLSARMDLSGSPAEAVSEIVSDLTGYGRCDRRNDLPEGEALGIFLLAVRGQVGCDRRAEIDALLAKYEMLDLGAIEEKSWQKTVWGDRRSSDPAPRDASEAQLLDAVRNEVAGRLAQSLHNRVYIELHKQEDPSQVEPPWSVDVKLGNAPSQRYPEGTSVVEIFDCPAIGGRLLILGAPGSGKTTMLLQLADELVGRAIATASHPIPVLLNLSAWQPEFQDIPTWIVANLKQKYGIRKDIAEQWLADGRILPLLDGLDELMSARQETCVRALNAFLPEWSGVPLVACSRRKAYQLYKTDLGLNGAILLQPLTDAQIERFLRDMKCEWLWEAVRNDADMMDVGKGLARFPLFLMLLVLASENLSEKLWQREESRAERQQLLFEVYITKQLKRPYTAGGNLPATREVKKPYRDDEKIKMWLGWLASRSIEENQTEFFIERLQPHLLSDRCQKRIYGFVYGLIFSLVYVPIANPIVSLFLEPSTGFLVSLIGGIGGGLIFGLAMKADPIQPVEKIQYAWNFWSKKFASNLLAGLFMGILLGALFSLSSNFSTLVLCVFLGLAAGLVYGWIELFTVAEIDTKHRDNQGIYRSISNSIVFDLIFTPFWILISATIYSFNEMLVWNRIIAQGTAFGFGVGILRGGLDSAIRHSALRITLWLFGYSPWNYSKFLRYCTDRGFLQRVGGGYRFVHALLRDHFAAEYGARRGDRA